MNEPGGERKNFVHRDEGFDCAFCGASVSPLGSGTCRDHCPRCLWGLHVDRAVPGDRASPCRGALEPIGVLDAGAAIAYRCRQCGERKRNRTAPDDDAERLIELSARPVAGPNG